MVERPLRQQKGNKQMSKRKPPPPRYRFSTKNPINALAARVLPKHRYRSRPTGNISLRRAERMIALAEAAGMKETVRDLKIARDYALRRRAAARKARLRKLRKRGNR
jgi:hypothetical protein